MLCYANMRWDLKGMSFDQLWDLETREAETGIETIESGYVKHLYEVAAQQRVVAYADVPSLIDLDRTAMGRLPMHEHLIFEDVWALEEGYTLEDVPGYLRARRETQDNAPRLLFSLLLSWDSSKRILDKRWDKLIKALKASRCGTILSIYRVAAQQRLIIIADVEKASDLSALCMLEGLEDASVEEVTGLRDYILFAEDVKKHYQNV